MSATAVHTLAELLPRRSLREPLEGRHDELDRLLLDRLPALAVVLQDPRQPMALRNLLKDVKEPRELLLHRALALVPVLEQRLHERREVGVEVASLGGAEGRGEDVERRLGEQRGDVGARVREQPGAEVGDVVEEEHGAERGAFVRAGEGDEAADDGVHDVD